MIKEKDFGGVRFLTVLTPDTFTRKMIVISTVFQISGKSGETAIKYVSALNSFDADYNNGPWEKLKKHTSLKEAKAFHEKTVSEQRYMDCEPEGPSLR